MQGLGHASQCTIIFMGRPKRYSNPTYKDTVKRKGMRKGGQNFSCGESLETLITENPPSMVCCGTITCKTAPSLANCLTKLAGNRWVGKSHIVFPKTFIWWQTAKSFLGDCLRTIEDWANKTMKNHNLIHSLRFAFTETRKIVLYVEKQQYLNHI